MSTEPRTVTLDTEDFGPVTIPCPDWCAGHQDHCPDTARVDIAHCGPAVDCTFLGIEVFTAELVQSPYSASTHPELGGPTPGVSVYSLGRTLDPTALYSLAAALDGYADQLRDLGDQLASILDGGERR